MICITIIRQYTRPSFFSLFFVVILEKQQTSRGFACCLTRRKHPPETPLNNLDWVSSQLNVSAGFLQNFPPYFLQLPTFFDISHKCIRANCTKVTKLVNTRKIWENSLKTSVGGITCILDLLSWVDRARVVNKDKRLSQKYFRNFQQCIVLNRFGKLHNSSRQHIST